MVHPFSMIIDNKLTINHNHQKTTVLGPHFTTPQHYSKHYTISTLHTQSITPHQKTISRVGHFEHIV